MIDPTDEGYNARITRLEQRVARIESAGQQYGTGASYGVCGNSRGPLKVYETQSQAAQTQATEHLYAPLRNDVKAITELSAFVREVAQLDAAQSYIGAMLTLRRYIGKAKVLLDSLSK